MGFKESNFQSIQVVYKGKKLQPGKEYYWKVMVWDNQNTASEWSEPSAWQMGLPDRKDWKGAQWIAYAEMPDSLRIVPGIHGKGNPDLGPGKDILPLLRKEFAVKKTIKKATVFISGLGHFDLRLNGEKVGDHFLDAGWTQYSKNALYVTFDITDQLRKGKNAIGVYAWQWFLLYAKGTLSQANYRLRLSENDIAEWLWNTAMALWKNIVSDNSWKADRGPVTFQVFTEEKIIMPHSNRWLGLAFI